MTSTTSPTERVGRYQLLEPIGIGPSGSVARAKVFGVAGFERQFAVKRFHPELTSTAAMAAMLSAAARAYGSLEHPRIARMSEFGVAQGATFTAVEYVLGLDALRLVGEARLAGVTLAPGGALALVSQAARAVGYAHGRGLTHLGLAPTNVIVTADGDIKITDFGILSATLPQRPIDVPRLTQRIPYLAPEQLANEATSAATDVFALGVLAYELVTGTRTFRGDTPQQVASAIMAGPPAEPPLPRPIVRVLQRCLARSPFERFPDARALADALDAALRVAPVPGTRKDIGAQVKETLDRLAALNDGQLSGMVALHLGTGPIRRLSDDDVRSASPAADPGALLSYEIGRNESAGGFASPASTLPDLPRLPITTMPGLAPPPIPVPPGIAAPSASPLGSPPGTHTLMGMGKSPPGLPSSGAPGVPPAIPPIKPRAATTNLPPRPPAVPPARRTGARTEVPAPEPASTQTEVSAIHALDPSDLVHFDDALGEADGPDASFADRTVLGPTTTTVDLATDLADADADPSPTAPFSDDFLDAPTRARTDSRTSRVTVPSQPNAVASSGSQRTAASGPASQPRLASPTAGSGPASQPRLASPTAGSGPASQPRLASPTAGSGPASQPRLASPTAGSGPASQPRLASPTAGSGPASASGSGPTSASGSQSASGPASQPRLASTPASGPTSQARPAAPATSGLASAASSSGTRPAAAPSTGSGPTASSSSGSGPSVAPSTGSGPNASSSSGSGLSAAPSTGSGPSAASTSGSGPSSAPSTGAGPSAAPSLFDPIVDPADRPTVITTAANAELTDPLGESLDRAVTNSVANYGDDLDPDAGADRQSSQTILGFAAPLSPPRAKTGTSPSPIVQATGPVPTLPQAGRPLGETQPEDVQPEPPHDPPRATPAAPAGSAAAAPPGWITTPPRLGPPPITPLPGSSKRGPGWLLFGLIVTGLVGVGVWQVYVRTGGGETAKVATAPSDARTADATTPASDAGTAAPDDATKLAVADAGTADATKLAGADAGAPDATKLAVADAGTADATKLAVADAGAPRDAARTDATQVAGTPVAPGDTLAIASTPAGARVFLDGADTGATPIKLPGTPDRHTIALMLPGHELYVAQVDGHGTFQIPLKEVTPTNGPAGIKVMRCKPDRYYVFVDGKPTGQICPTERIGCEVGAHTVEVYDVVSETRRKWDIVVKDTRLSFRVRVD